MVKGDDAGPLVWAVVGFAERLLEEDMATNKAIGDHGAGAILGREANRGWVVGGWMFVFFLYIFPYMLHIHTYTQAVRPRDDALQHRLARHGGVRHGAGSHPLAART